LRGRGKKAKERDGEGADGVRSLYIPAKTKHNLLRRPNEAVYKAHCVVQVVI
jgi:hypothetical protein